MIFFVLLLGLGLRPTPRGGTTPRAGSRTPRSRASTPGRNMTAQVPDPDCYVAIMEGRGTAKETNK